MLRFRTFVVLAAVLAGGVLWVVGRQSTLKPSEIRPLAHSTSGAAQYHFIKGLDSALAHSSDHPVRVLIVHGMKTNLPGYSTTLQRGLASRLGLKPAPIGKSPDSPPDSVVIIRGYEVSSIGMGPQPLESLSLRPSELRTWSWTDATGRERLIFYEILWAPLRDAVKRRFFACFEARTLEGESCTTADAEQNHDRRAALNRFIKEQILVDGIADATVVLGPMGDILRDDVTLAFCMVAQDVLRRTDLPLNSPGKGRCDLSTVLRPEDQAAANGALRTSEFFVVTHSLGSFLVMDAQWHALQAAGRHSQTNDQVAMLRDVSAFHLLDDATVFMRANQIGLLQLARLQPWCDPPQGSTKCPNEALITTDDVGAAPQPQSLMTTYVAFNDANDLLGFELPPYLTLAGVLGSMVNITVRNPSWWRVPFIWKSPEDAHLRSDKNPAVLNAIAKGFALPPVTVPSAK